MRMERKTKPATHRRPKNCSSFRQNGLRLLEKSPLADHELKPGSILSRLVTWLKQCCFFRWSHADAALKPRIMGCLSWSTTLVQISLWLLLLWIISELYIGLPSFIIALVYCLYTAYRRVRTGRELPALFQHVLWNQGDYAMNAHGE